MPSGKSPGVDGIPIELYRKFKDYFIPILTELFSACMRTRSTPGDFSLGLMISLYKKGDPHQVSNYRPITLLNTDYRLFAKILSRRLVNPLARIISPEQTAFLPRRRIGDSIMLVQSMDALLKQQKQSALLVSCDFEKAYDTVSRAFLYNVMEASGFTRFVPLLQLLLSSTNTSAFANGFVSKRVQFLAGVRQGCPISPLVYLFVGHALNLFLKSRNLGIKMTLWDSASWKKRAMVRSSFVASQYADDCDVFLPAGGESLSLFSSTMETFEKASGQKLNAAKTNVFVLGNPLPSTRLENLKDASPFTFVSSLRVLGTCLGTRTDWNLHLEACKKKIRSLVKLSLSEFGRCFATSSYVYPTFLYEAEFSPLPPAGFFDKLLSMVRAFVDQGVYYEKGQGQSAPSVSLGLDFFCKHPSEGGSSW